MSGVNKIIANLSAALRSKLVIFTTPIFFVWASTDLPSLSAQVPGSAPFSFFKNRASPPTGGYRYYRFRALSKYDNCGSPGSSGVAELQFRWNGTWQTNAMTSNTTGTVGSLAVTTSASSEYSGSWPAWHAFDTLTSNNGWWTNGSSFGTTAPFDESTTNWLKVDFGAGNAPNITGMRVSGYNGTYTECSLDAFRLEYSSDDTGWTTVTNSAQTAQDTRNTTIEYDFTAEPAPPNPTSPSATVDSAAKITLSWTSGGGTTASYRIAYQTGTSAPADCNTGVVENTASTNRAMLNLSGGLQYSFRICALNSSNVLSSGITVTSTHTPPTAWYSGVTIATSDSSPYAGCIAPDETTMNDESTSNKTTWGSQSNGFSWIRVDLGSTKAVRYLRIGGLGAGSCWGGTGETYFNTINVSLSDDGDSWSSVIPTPAYKYSNSVIGNIDLGAGRTARYVRIEKTGWLTTGQFRVGADGCAGKWVAGSTACWYDAGGTSNSCTTTCASHGGYHNDTRDFAGSGGTNANCAEVAKAVHNLGSAPSVGTNSYSGVGCTHYSGSYGRDTTTTTAGATDSSDTRFCGCVN